jgi:hypothetical protein
MAPAVIVAAFSSPGGTTARVSAPVSRWRSAPSGASKPAIKRSAGMPCAAKFA